MNRDNIDKIARTPEDRMLLAKIWDKIDGGIRREIPAHTCFLSPRELEMARCLLGSYPGLLTFGGYPGAERNMVIYLPSYLDWDTLEPDAMPLQCLHAQFFQGDSLSHRDFLGALTGAGIGRETVGDICVGSGSCDFFVTAEIAPYVLLNLSQAGRTHLHITQVPLDDVRVPQPETREIRDTVASVRLDSVIASGFRVGRATAVKYIRAGNATINGLPCEKPDKIVEQGDRISVRGLGKLQLRSVNGQTKKGRISLVIDRFV